MDEKDIAYEGPRYSFNTGHRQGIQGNINSCYMDTSLFAIFTFNVMLDNMLLGESNNTDVEELRGILRNEIIYPLRSKGYVSCIPMAKFRAKLQYFFPGGKFIVSERDPEEFLEVLLKLLSPTKYFLRTVPMQKIENVQNCFLTQLFYESSTVKKNTDILEMLTLSFLEYDMFISTPPKCLILQLPRDGKTLKKFQRVHISRSLDVTPFIVICPKQCIKCQATGMGYSFCKICSLKNLQLTYYCGNDKECCDHEKIDMEQVGDSYQGKVLMELVSILCIEKSHYVTYVKTNSANGKWIYFNSMEKIDNGSFIPTVRETNLHNYFAKNGDQRKELKYDRDIEKIENYAFLCIYKYSNLEIYLNDFNSV